MPPLGATPNKACSASCCIDDTQDLYLCQVSDTVSCGACCGLYNLPNLSREKLETMLSKRTEAFAMISRTEDGFFEFKKRYKAPHRLSRPFPGFHHCPFLGFIGDGKGRVGCLLHPGVAGNNGVDYRSMSWYGEQACRNYFCPSTKKLSSVYQSIIRQTIGNWYDFGLIVTEYALVTAYFKELESRLGRPIVVNDYVGNNRAVSVFKAFAALKSKWPYRQDDFPGPCNYFFENGLYPRPAVFRTTSDIQLSCYEDIFRELDSSFSSGEELAEAEQLLDDLFSKTEQAIA